MGIGNSRRNAASNINDSNPLLYSTYDLFLFKCYRVMFLFCFTRGQCSKDCHRKPCLPAFSRYLEHQNLSAKTRFDEVLGETLLPIIILGNSAFMYRHIHLKAFWQEDFSD